MPCHQSSIRLSKLAGLMVDDWTGSGSYLTYPPLPPRSSRKLELLDTPFPLLYLLSFLPKSALAFRPKIAKFFFLCFLLLFFATLFIDKYRFVVHYHLLTYTILGVFSSPARYRTPLPPPTRQHLLPLPRVRLPFNTPLPTLSRLTSQPLPPRGYAVHRPALTTAGSCLFPQHQDTTNQSSVHRFPTKASPPLLLDTLLLLNY